MKTSLSNKYFAGFMVCFMTVFNSCDLLKVDTGEAPTGYLIYPKRMFPGQKLIFEMDAEDLDGDSLTYSWEANKGEFDATNRRAVSYTAPTPEIHDTYVQPGSNIIRERRIVSGGEPIHLKVYVSDGFHEISVEVSYFLNEFGTAWEAR